jgi:hypothetical protein
MNSKIVFGAAIAAFAAFAAISAPANAAFLYSSGPVNGTIDGYTLNFGYSVTDSFTITTADTIDTALYYTWETPGESETGIDWAITSAAFGGTTYASGAAAPITALVFPVGTVNGGYDIDSNAIAIGANLLPGTYWLELNGATTSNGDPTYWDENDGAGVGVDSALGVIGSESFNLYGTTYVPTPEASTYVGLLLGVAGLAAFGIMSARRRTSLSA